MARLNGFHVREWMQQPRLEKSTPHGGSAPIEGGQEAAIVLTCKGRGQLEVAEGRLIEKQVPLLLHEFHVLQRYVRKEVDCGEVVGSQTGG